MLLGLPDEKAHFQFLIHSRILLLTILESAGAHVKEERSIVLPEASVLRQFWVNDQQTAEEVISMETCVKRLIIQRTNVSDWYRWLFLQRVDNMQHVYQYINLRWQYDCTVLVTTIKQEKCTEDISIVRKFSYSSIDQQAANPTNKSVFSKVFTKCPSILSLKCSLSSVWISWTDQCFSCDWFSKT